MILVEALELFELFLSEDLVEILYTFDSVVEQCFLGFENFDLGCGNLLFVIAVERIVQSFFGILLLLAEVFKCRVHFMTLLFEGCLLFMRHLEHGVHEFGTFLEVKLLVETLAILEVVARTIVAAVAEVLVVETFAVVLAMILAAALAAVAIAVVLITIAMVFTTAGALLMRWRACGLLGTARGAKAAVCKAEGSNGKSEGASENNEACDKCFCGCVHYFVSCNK